MATELNTARFRTALLLAQAKKEQGPSIGVGSNRRNDVRAIQEMLSMAGYQLEVDGIFGPRTQAAVREFQQQFPKLKVDGRVGEKTLEKLKDAEPPERKPSTDPSIDKIGYVSTGTVKKPKDRGDSGPEGSSEGESKIDPETGKPVATADSGPIGSTTKGAYGRTDDHAPGDPVFEQQHPRGAGGRFIQKGDTGTPVRNTQKSLNSQGYNLKVDGQFGPKTEQAVKNFQATNDLQTDGVVGFKTAAALKRGSKR